MDLLNSIKDNTIVICENNYKNYILKELSESHTFLNVKFYTKNEFIKESTFKYDEKTISYLVKKYNLKIEIAKMHLDNLYYINKDNYISPKLNYLVKLKSELDKEKLLIYDNFFEKRTSNYHLLILGYPYLEEYELNIFNKYNVNYYVEEEITNLDKVYKFKTQNEEINFVCKSICKLLDKGVDINKIKIVGITKDYYQELKRISNFYNIPIRIPSEKSLYGMKVTKIFLDNFDLGMNNALELIKDYDKEIANKIVSICNKYVLNVTQIRKRN